MARAELDLPELTALPEGLNDPAERRAAGRMVGLLWMVGGISGVLWYLVPGAETSHWRLGLVSTSFSTALGLACVAAPWARLSPTWIYASSGLSLIVIPIVMAINGGADSPTVLYLFLASVLFGYYLPTRAACAFLGFGILVPATPMLYDPQALEPTFIAEYVLTAPIYAAVGLTVVLAKRQLVGWRNQSREQAMLDPLTGLANRRALGEVLSRVVIDPRTPRPIAVMMIDLDDFKLANTLHGHPGGDLVLRTAADVLRRVTRHDDLVARLGGDEFALLLCGASEAELAELAQRIVDAMRSTELPLSPPGYRLTASVGFAMVAAGGDGETLLAAADRELGRAKSGGKDRWDASDAPLPEHRARVGT